MHIIENRGNVRISSLWMDEGGDLWDGPSTNVGLAYEVEEFDDYLGHWVQVTVRHNLEGAQLSAAYHRGYRDAWISACAECGLHVG